MHWLFSFELSENMRELGLGKNTSFDFPKAQICLLCQAESKEWKCLHDLELGNKT
jgi:hypothetical protein